jgi:hypothetical protein
MGFEVCVLGNLLYLLPAAQSQPRHLQDITELLTWEFSTVYLIIIVIAPHKNQ